jgi:hypothetical protein
VISNDPFAVGFYHVEIKAVPVLINKSYKSRSTPPAEWISAISSVYPFMIVVVI